MATKRDCVVRSRAKVGWAKAGIVRRKDSDMMVSGERMEKD